MRFYFIKNGERYDLTDCMFNGWSVTSDGGNFVKSHVKCPDKCEDKGVYRFGNMVMMDVSHYDKLMKIAKDSEETCKAKTPNHLPVREDLPKGTVVMCMDDDGDVWSMYSYSRNGEVYADASEVHYTWPFDHIVAYEKFDHKNPNMYVGTEFDFGKKGNKRKLVQNG